MPRLFFRYCLLLLLVLFVTPTVLAVDVNFDTKGTRITIRGKEVTYITTTYTFDSPMSSIPSGQEEVTKKGKLSPSQESGLKKLLYSSTFFTMDSVYGISTRRYGTKIRVKDGTKTKEVTYWSGPGKIIKPLPADFTKIQRYLETLAQEVTINSPAKTKKTGKPVAYKQEQ